MTTTEAFLDRWLAVVATYAASSAQEREELVARLLDTGLPPAAAADTVEVTAEQRAALERHVVRASGLFDPFGYFWHNPDVFWDLCGHDEELRHFVDQGWKELRNPHPGFDLWDYWVEHLDPATETLNPFVHYLVEGRHRGHAPLPLVEVLDPPEPPDPDRPPRRVCLFAAFDVDGVVDPTVVAYVADLSRFADVYYLADCEMDPDELAKLEPHTAGRWAIRHGRYDFGSYSMLARDLVGWDVIDGYDELLLANDSCYLVQPLDQVFERMDAATCDWWGLQATYERFGTHEYRTRGRPLPLDELVGVMRGPELWRYTDFVHVGSYFLAFRRRVHTDPRFRARLDAVAPQTDKTHIILKYEIGFSRLLILAGYHLTTYVDGVLPYHPVYRGSAFELLRDGFPVLKRQFLYENPFRQPDLRRWKERVLEAVPGADVASMEQNLLRVAPFFKLERSFALTTGRDGRVVSPPPVDPSTFAEEEASVPRHPHWWVFTVDPRTGLLGGSARAVFEAVRHDGGVKKIVLHGERRPVLGPAHNLVLARVESADGQAYAMRAGVLVVTVGPRADLNHPLSLSRRRFVRVGDPGLVDLPEPPLSPAAQHDVDLTRVVVLESSDGLARAAAVYPHVPEEAFWVTGNPRHDLLVAPEHELPPVMRAQLADLRGATSGRPLVVVGATTDIREDIDLATTLADELAVHLGPDAVVALRTPPSAAPPYGRGRTGAGPVRPGEVLRLPPDRLADEEMAWRLARVVVTASAVDRHDLDVTGAAVALDPRTPALVDEVRTALGTPQTSPAPLADGGAGRRVARALKRIYLPIDDWLAEAEQLVR